MVIATANEYFVLVCQLFIDNCVYFPFALSAVEIWIMVTGFVKTNLSIVFLSDHLLWIDEETDCVVNCPVVCCDEKSDDKLITIITDNN